jgi:hypothetical protein
MEQFADLLSGTIAFVLWAGMYLAFAISLHVIAKKTSTKNAWLAWIPILQFILLLDIAGMDWWMILIFLIPCVGWIFNGYVWSKVAQERGKSEFIGWLVLVPFVNFFVPLYLAFSD